MPSFTSQVANLEHVGPSEILDTAKQYESAISFLQEKLSELRKNNKFLLIHTIDADKNATNISVPVNDINDLNLLSNVQGVYNEEDKAVYIPKWISLPHPIAHEIGHALYNAKAPNFNKDPNKFSNLSSSDKNLRTLYVNSYLPKTGFMLALLILSSGSIPSFPLGLTDKYSACSTGLGTSCPTDPTSCRPQTGYASWYLLTVGLERSFQGHCRMTKRTSLHLQPGFKMPKISV